nr:type I inositol polyphosphate 5-phosphatase 10 isoform X1 [Tanacetum cinerariifolium]
MTAILEDIKKSFVHKIMSMRMNNGEEGKVMKNAYDPTEIQVASGIGVLDCADLLGDSMSNSRDIQSLRVFTATWNVAGISPSSDLNLDNLLQIHRESDIYVLGMNTTSIENASKTDDRIDMLADQISTLVDIFAKKVVTPAPVRAVEESCVTCGGNHAYYNCPNTDNNQPSVCVATGTYNQVVHQNRASNFMAPPGFAPVQNNQNRYNQG